MKTIWLHIGIRKSGSTAIQDFLCHNKEKLLEMGYDYPTDFSPEAKNSLRLGLLRLPQCGNINHLVTNAFKAEKQTMKQMLQNLKIPEDKDVILSSENFYFVALNENLLTEFKNIILSKTKNHQFKIIIYLRRQDEILESMYRQDIQDINYKAFKFKKEYLDDPDTQNTLNFEKFINVYAKFFGKENLIIRPFEREQLKNKNVVSDFIDIIGIKDTTGLNINLESNITFSHEIVEYLRLAKTYIPGLHKRLTNYFTHINIPVRSQALSLVNPAIKKKIALEYEQMNNKIAKDYLGRNQLFLKPLPEEDRGWKPYDMSADDAVRVSSILFASLIQQFFALSDEVKVLKRTLKEFLELQIKEQQENKVK